MTGFKLIGWGAILFGLLVFFFPHLLNDLVAIFFILMGVNFLAWGRNFTQR